MYKEAHPQNDLVTYNDHFIEWAQTVYLRRMRGSRQACQAVLRVIQVSPTKIQDDTALFDPDFLDVLADAAGQRVPGGRHRIRSFDLRCREESLSPNFLTSSQ